MVWAVREKLIKTVLLWQARNMERSYHLWRQRQARADCSQPANPAASGARPAPGEPLICVNILLRAGERPEDVQSTLASLIDQAYPAWEAAVYFPAEWGPVDRLLSNPARQDARICTVPYPADQEENLYRAALERAEAEWVCWARAGGAFAPDAFGELACQVERYPVADVFYYDEDVLQPGKTGGQLPFLKPGWSPALLLSVNYLRGGFYRGAFLRQSLKKDAPILSEWDLALRCSPYMQQAVRIARVLFHAPVGGSEPAAVEKDDRALAGHLERLGMAEPHVRRTAGGHPQVTWKVRDHKVSIIIPTKDNLSVLQKCVESIQIQAPNLEHEIILIDTCSQDPNVEAYYRQIAQDSRITLLRDTAPFNYSRVNNVGAAHATGDLFLFLNNDVQALAPGWIEELVRWMEYPGVGVVGPKLLFPDGTIQHAGIVLGMEGHASHVFGNAAGDYPNPFGSLDWYRNYQAVTGACLMTSREVFEQAGGFDEGYWLVFSDVAYCLEAVRQGYQVVYTPFCNLIHHEGKSRARLIPPEDTHLGYQQFIALVRDGDSYYHPGLSYSVRQPVFAWGFEQRPADRLEEINRYALLKLGRAAGKDDHHS